ncbi:hypothetical protein MRB53_008392 [Persea americana]|uniref:Uncharacterized protein n=1 Tax=Persea americana TaxID=3435 RepID=A0ACC2MLN5_PERAE|nr:hypothetical protein MRB53_008392 [Persea americana]
MEEEKPSSSESAVHEEDGKAGSSTNGDQGWQTVTYAKRRRKSQPSKPSPGLDPEKSSSEAFSDSSNVFRPLEQHSEEQIHLLNLPNLQESQKAVAETVSKSKPSTSGAAGSSSDDGGDSDGEVARGAENKVEAKKRKEKKPKKTKITISDAAEEIDASALAAFLADATKAYEEFHFLQLMRFADYFACAFSKISPSQFQWPKMLKESSVAMNSIMPLCYISEPVYKTSIEWISKRSANALGEFLMWSLDCALEDLAGQQSGAKSYKKSIKFPHSKALVGIFVGIAMVLRWKPDVLISQLPTLMDHPRYQGQDKIPLYVWVISQACAGDLGVGMHSWAQILLPYVSGNSSCNPQLRDLVLQLVERILSDPKARPVLFNGVVRKRLRLVPPHSLDMLMRVTFPAPASRIKATERFEAIYPALKELALAGSPGTKAMKQVSQQLLPLAAGAISESKLNDPAENPELSKEAAVVFIWCLAQNADCYKQWEMLHFRNKEASVIVLQMLAGQWNDHAMRLAPLDNMKETLKSLRLKNRQMLAQVADPYWQACFKDANKYCEVILRRLTGRFSCMGSGVVVLTLAIATGAILLSPNMDLWDWKNLHIMISSSVLNIK